MTNEPCPHCGCPSTSDREIHTQPEVVTEYRHCVLCGWTQTKADFPPPEVMVEEAMSMLSTTYYVVFYKNGERMPWDIPSEKEANRLAKSVGGHVASWSIDAEWEGELPVPFYAYCSECEGPVPGDSVSSECELGDTGCLLRCSNCPNKRG